MAKKDSVAGSGRAAGFTELGRVKALIALMTENGLSEIELVEDKSRILLRRGAAAAGAGHVAAGTAGGIGAGHHAPIPVHTHAGAAAGAGGGEAARVDEELETIKSPMVGTFYAAASPDSDPYVSVGTDVEKDKTVVCVIEAMKMFNEIHADASGTVTKILVTNGQAVEFGQPLFLVKPE